MVVDLKKGGRFGKILRLSSSPSQDHLKELHNKSPCNTRLLYGAKSADITN